MRLPERKDDLAGIREAAAGSPTARATSSSSAPAGPRSAGRRWRSLPAMPCPASGPCARRRACISSTISTRSRSRAAGQAAARHDAFRRHLEIRRHRRNPDADHRRAVRGQKAGARSARAFPRHQRAGQARQAQRSARPARRASGGDARPRHRRRRALFGADQCRPVAGGHARSRYCRHPRAAPARALAPVLASKPAGRGAGRAWRRAGDCAGREQGQVDQRADGLCRPAGALHALVCAALGREPRQERQGHDAAGGARPGRSAQPGAVVHRRPARQIVHCGQRRRRAAADRASTANSPGSPASPGFGGKTIGDLVAAEARATAETLGQERLPGAQLHLAGSTRKASAS